MMQKAEKKGFSLVELMIVAGLALMLLGFAWKFYFGGRDAMTHTVSQSQVQADTRIFLDQLEVEMGSCYSFHEIDPENKKFSFYSFTFARMPLDEVLYKSDGTPRPNNSESDARIKVVKYEYSWADKKVTKKRTPGWLKFLRKPMEFSEGDASQFIDPYKKMEKVVLRDIVDFEFKGYKQMPDATAESGFKTLPVTPDKAAEAAFITLRLHTFKDESPRRRDEELDIVTKFYSQTRLAEVANPYFFCTTDNQGKF
ncbi:MAG: prepilin-type N-terminal cleavage/methylation domain-containing protein [Candidatus Riflebacteria bacterium]